VSGGELYIVGREQDRFCINGQNYYAHDVERVCEQLPALASAQAAALGVLEEPDKTCSLVVLVQYPRQELELFARLADQLRQWLLVQLGVLCRHILPIRQLPRTTSGKLQRFALKERYLAGDFTPIVDELQSISRRVEAARSDSQR